MSHVAGFELSIDWISVFMLMVIFLMVANMHLGIDYSTMLLPFRGIIPGLYGFDTMIIFSAILSLFKGNWDKYGWFVTFAAVFGFIWMVS
jgi:hypothetical protein